MEVCDYCLCLKGGFPCFISIEQVSPETRDLSVFVATIAVQFEPQLLLARQTLKEAVVDPGKLVPLRRSFCSPRECKCRALEHCEWFELSSLQDCPVLCS